MNRKTVNKAVRFVTRTLLPALLLVLLVGIASLPVYAADMDYTCSGKVNEVCDFVLYSDDTDVITDATLISGSVPGMDLYVGGEVTLGVAGTPTTPGTYVLSVSLTTQNMGTVDVQITVTITNPTPPVEGTPKITKHPSGEDVVEGESATFIARADNTRQYVWSIALADAVVDCVDLPAYLGGDVKVSGYDTDTLVISNIPIELDGAYVRCRFVGAEESVNSDSAKITVTAQEDAKPVVTKDPTDETVDEGGKAVFVARAKYAQKYQWKMVSPDGVTTDCADAAKTFKDLKVTGADSEALILENIPSELDGYRFFCKFIGGEETSGNAAKLSVNAASEPTEAPTEEPTAASTEVPEDAPAEETQADIPEDEDKPSHKEPDQEDVEDREEDDPGDTDPEDADRNDRRRTTGLIITAIIAVVAIAIGATAGYVILKMNRTSGRKKR